MEQVAIILVVIIIPQAMFIPNNHYAFSVEVAFHVANVLFILA